MQKTLKTTVSKGETSLGREKLFWEGLEKIHELKEGNFMLCEDILPTVFASDSFFTDIFVSSIITGELLSTLSCADVDEVDQNLFTALCSFHKHKLSIPSEDKFIYLSHMSSRLCHRSNVKRLTNAFQINLNFYLLSTVVDRKDWNYYVITKSIIL